MEKDQRDLLRVFNERKVKYLVLGGYEDSHFTQPRVTKDLDIFIDTSDENVAIVYAALAAFGATCMYYSQKLSRPSLRLSNRSASKPHRYRSGLERLALERVL